MKQSEYRRRLIYFSASSVFTALLLGFLTAVAYIVAGKFASLFYLLGLATMGYAFYNIFRFTDQRSYIVGAVIVTSTLSLIPVIGNGIGGLLETFTGFMPMFPEISLAGTSGFHLLFILQALVFNAPLIYLYSQNRSFDDFSDFPFYIFPVVFYGFFHVVLAVV